MEKLVYAAECLWCGSELSETGLCVNTECEHHPQGDALHSHLEDRKLCLDVWCPDNAPKLWWPEKMGHMVIEHQRACSYCEYTADFDGICDDDDCPTHLPGFNPPEYDPDNPADNGGKLTPNHWLVRDGLVNEDGSLTALGQECEDWVMQRLDEEDQDGEDEEDD